MYEDLMEQVVTPDNATAAWLAVKRNGGAPGIDGMTTEKRRDPVRQHWETIRGKLLAGTYVPSPVRRVEIPKPNGGVRLLGIPTVLDRWIQQMLLQKLQAIFDPTCHAQSFGFRPGKSAHDAVRAAQSYVPAGKDWVVDMDITKFFDRVNHDSLMNRIGQTTRDKRVLGLMGRYLRAGVMVEGLGQARRKAGRSPRCWPTFTWTRWTKSWNSVDWRSAGRPTTATFMSAVNGRRNECWRA